MARRLRLILLIVIVIGGIIVAVGFQVNSDNYPENFEEKNQLEKLRDYKSSLEKINQFNYGHLVKLEKDLVNSTNENKNSIKKEIEIVEKIIKENNDEIQKISERIEHQT